jgi:aspartyl-tRNA(Asn)/glutamyl-tRNA(Gln) amidotransferase subunit A
MKDLCFSSITSLSEEIRLGKISPLRLVQECLARIDQLNPKLNAFITVLKESALHAAEAAEREISVGKWRGPLHGIPIGIKDMFDTAGIRTTAAFEHFQHRIPKTDAVAVTRLKQAGAIILGKLNMHELAMGTTSAVSYFGPVHNPWDGNYVAGGSSGGSAAAVAAGLCFASLDTDAIGSCRLPAACCGVVGFKPSFGRVSLEGVLAGEPVDEVILALAHVGVMCRQAEDVPILMRALEGTQDDTLSPTLSTTASELKSTRIGVARNFEATSEVRAAFSAGVEALRMLNCQIIVNVTVPFESASFDIRNIAKDRQRINAALFENFDFLVMPTLSDTPPTIEAAMTFGPQAVSPANTFFSNYFGLPTITIPSGKSRLGLPFGMQIMGAPGRDEEVLKLAQAFQLATPWNPSHPLL